MGSRPEKAGPQEKVEPVMCASARRTCLIELEHRTRTVSEVGSRSACSHGASMRALTLSCCRLLHFRRSSAWTTDLSSTTWGTRLCASTCRSMCLEDEAVVQMLPTLHPPRAYS